MLLPVLLIAGVAFAAAYGGSVEGPFEVPLFAKGGFFVGAASTASTTNRVTVIRACQIDNLVLATAAANVCVTATATCAGVALGTHIDIAPQQDDAAWDEGQLDAFVESANTVKVTYCADATGADPADTNDYQITWWQHAL
jgi:hypothetical protein